MSQPHGDGEVGDPELERALAAALPPAAGSTFRQALRTEFQAGFPDRVALESSADPAENRSRGTAPRRTAERVPMAFAFDKTPLAPPARSAFRAELRAAFVSGSLEREGRLAGRPRGTSTSPVQAAPAHEPGGVPTSRRLLGLASGLAAAAALLLLLQTWSADRSRPTWLVRDLGQGGQVLVAGQSIAAADVGALSAALDSGQELETGEGMVEAVFGGKVRLRIAPGSLLRPAAARAMGAGRPAPDSVGGLLAHMELVRGEIWIQTVHDYQGVPLEVETPDARVRIVGTVLSVAAMDFGTCVCVDTGEVLVEQKSEGATRGVPVGRHSSCLVFGDGSPLHNASFDDTLAAMPGMAEEHYPSLQAFANEEL